jgi:hypothetical protein
MISACEVAELLLKGAFSNRTDLKQELRAVNLARVAVVEDCPEDYVVDDHLDSSSVGGLSRRECSRKKQETDCVDIGALEDLALPVFLLLPLVLGDLALEIVAADENGLPVLWVFPEQLDVFASEYGLRIFASERNDESHISQAKTPLLSESKQPVASRIRRSEALRGRGFWKAGRMSGEVTGTWKTFPPALTGLIPTGLNISPSTHGYLSS